MKPKKFDDRLEDLIDEVVIKLNEPLLDDMYPDVLSDWDNRVEAIDYLLEKLTKLKAE